MKIIKYFKNLYFCRSFFLTQIVSRKKIDRLCHRLSHSVWSVGLFSWHTLCHEKRPPVSKILNYVEGLFSWHRVCHEKRPPVSKILNYSDGLFSWHRVCHEKRPPLCFLQDVSYYLYLTFLIINISLIIIWYFMISFLKTFIFHDFFEKSAATRNAFSLKEMTIFFKIAPT